MKNIKEFKKEIENKIKEEIEIFQKETGLDILYVEINRPTFLGFKVNNNHLNVSIKLKD